MALDVALPALEIRAELRPGDVEEVRRIVGATGFFDAREVDVAGELVEERLRLGTASGYHFFLAERAGQLFGYACYGPIPLTRSSYDLYWIVVDRSLQRAGLGRRLLASSEAAAAAAGGELLYAETSSCAHYAPTRAFYRAAGYRVVADIADFYAPGDGKVIFEKRLAPGR